MNGTLIPILLNETQGCYQVKRCRRYFECPHPNGLAITLSQAAGYKCTKITYSRILSIPTFDLVKFNKSLVKEKRIETTKENKERSRRREEMKFEKRGGVILEIAPSSFGFTVPPSKYL
jgi:hypothetical protein